MLFEKIGSALICLTCFFARTQSSRPISDEFFRAAFHCRFSMFTRTRTCSVWICPSTSIFAVFIFVILRANCPQARPAALRAAGAVHLAEDSILTLTIPTCRETTISDTVPDVSGKASVRHAEPIVAIPEYSASVFASCPSSGLACRLPRIIRNAVSETNSRCELPVFASS